MMRFDARISGELAFATLDQEICFAWLDSRESPHICAKRGIAALGAVHQFWIERGTYPKVVLDAEGFVGSTPWPGPSADPIDAAIYDANLVGARWYRPFGKPTVQPRSKELVAPEDMEVYGRTLGIIERRCRGALASLDEEAGAEAPAFA